MSGTIDGFAEAERRIAAEAEQRTGRLDLRNLGLERLPEGLFALTHLRDLDMGAERNWRGGKPNAVQAQASRLAGLARLEVLDLSSSDLIGLDLLRSLANLQDLKFRDTPVADLAPLRSLAKLQDLDCFDTPVADLAPLRGLANLQSLHCASTLVSNLGSLIGLAALRSIDCSRTVVDNLAPLAGLTTLRSIICAATQVADIGPLHGLAELQELYCSRTQVAQLAPLRGLTNLRTLDCSRTRVADLTPLRGLAFLQRLDCSENPIADLDPLTGLGALTRIAARNCRIARLPRPLGGLTGLAKHAGPFEQGGGGLHLEGNPLPDAFQDLVALGQPEATRRILALLRSNAVEDEEADPQTTQPDRLPDIPAPGPGMHVELNEAGVVGFAPPDALDRDGNHVRRLRSLHPEMKAVAADLCVALSRGNQPPSALRQAAEGYAAVIAKPLTGIDFALLIARGVRLRNTATETWAAIERGSEPDLNVEAGAALRTLLDLHGPFVGATRDGIEMAADEEADRSTPEERRAQKAATVAFAKALEAEGSIAEPGLVAELRQSAEASGEGPNPARSSAVAAAQARHVVSASYQWAAQPQRPPASSLRLGQARASLPHSSPWSPLRIRTATAMFAPT